jgi:hypothetical protein
MRRYCEPREMSSPPQPDFIGSQETVDMASTATFRIAFFLMMICAAILGGCNDGSSNPTGASSANAATSGALSISGIPSQGISVGSSYSFRPTATEPSAAPLTFSITNRPAWATFDPATGTLSGTPSAANVGLSPEIVISVSDGTASATLAAFSIEVTQGGPGVASLSWTTPASASSVAPELAGYYIYYGENFRDLRHIVNVADPGLTNYVVDNLATGTWYFAITTYDINHIESSLSVVVPVTI